MKVPAISRSQRSTFMIVPPFDYMNIWLYDHVVKRRYHEGNDTLARPDRTRRRAVPYPRRAGAHPPAAGAAVRRKKRQRARGRGRLNAAEREQAPANPAGGGNHRPQAERKQRLL